MKCTSFSEEILKNVVQVHKYYSGNGETEYLQFENLIICLNIHFAANWT